MACAELEATIGVSEETRQPASLPYMAAPLLDDWELDEHLRRVARVLAVETNEPTKSRTRIRQDSAHYCGSPRHLGTEERSGLRNAVRQFEQWQARRVLPLLTGFSLLAGAMTLACGSMLLGWSVVCSRQELWRIGLPISVGGGVVLVVGLLLLFDRSLRKANELRDSDRPKHSTERKSTYGDDWQKGPWAVTEDFPSQEVRPERELAVRPNGSG